DAIAQPAPTVSLDARVSARAASDRHGGAEGAGGRGLVRRAESKGANRHNRRRRGPADRALRCGARHTAQLRAPGWSIAWWAGARRSSDLEPTAGFQRNGH